MGKLGGFLEHDRKEPQKRTIEERLKDYLEINKETTLEEITDQASRCMDCGVPFCHFSCPLCNLVPEFNDAVYKKQYKKAAAIISQTNNFPEFTGRLCPALCEKGCVLGIGFKSVTISNIEKYIIEIAFEEGWIKPNPPQERTGKKVAVIGSGPAGLATADLLNSAGHNVTVYEKNKKIGGILAYGIPDFKIEKKVIDRRVNLLKDEGVDFKTGINVGEDITIKELQKEFDVICLAIGAEFPRNLDVSGRDLDGIHFAMEYLVQQNKRVNGEELTSKEILAKDKHVLVIGGGDTGSDCVGTANRQGAKCVTQIEIMPKAPEKRTEEQPWPSYPNLFKVSTSHEEGCERQFEILTKEFTGEDGKVKSAKCVKVNWEKSEGKFNMKEVAGSDFEIKADLVLLAMGFVHPIKTGLIEQLKVKLNDRGNVVVDENNSTSVKNIFAAGDVQSGASLIVHAIAGGRRMARNVDMFLMGDSDIPEV